MGNLSIAVNGKPLEYTQLRQVKSGTSLEQAEDVLKADRDGLDTIGVSIEGVDYLITGKGLEAKKGDTITVEGQAAGTVDFVENEENTFGEGFKAGMKTKGPLGVVELAIMSPGLPVSRGLVRGSVAAVRGWTANEKAIDKVTQGPAIDKKMVEDAAKAIAAMFGGDED